MRKFINKYIFVVSACLAAISSCQDIYIDEYEELALDYTKLNVKREGGNFAFMVYYSGDWTIELDKEVSWAKLEKRSGTGITPVHIDVEENFAFKRSFNMIITAGSNRDTVLVTQAPAVDTPHLRFNEQSVSLSNGSGKVSVLLQSNLMESAIQLYSPVVEYIQGNDWLKYFTIESASDGYIVENGIAWYTYRVVFEVSENDGAEDRAAYISYKLYDQEVDMTYSAEMAITQSTLPGQIIIKDQVVRGSGKKDYSESITGGLERYADKIDCQVVYNGESDFVENVYIKDGRLYYTLKENNGSSPREADIVVTYGDNVSASTIKIIQREAGVNAILEISSAQDLLAWNNDSANWAADDLVLLTDDIDCAGIIKSANWTPRTFKGTFDGNGKTIDNFVIEKAGEASFFAKVDGGHVKNLTFGTGCSFTATAATSGKRIYAASLASVVSGTATLTNVINKGTVNTSETATGGTSGNYIAGICSSFQSTATATGCENHGPVTFMANPEAWVNCGGLFGEVTKACVLKDCKNYGTIQFSSTNKSNKTLNLAGIAAGANVASFDSCMNHGSIESNVEGTNTGEINIAGIVGIDNAGVLAAVSGCENHGNLTNNSAAGNLRMGGFIGCIKGHATDVTYFKNYGLITNEGTVTSWVAMGGVVGLINGLNTAVNNVSDCENHGDLLNNVSKGRVTLGGIVGFVQTSSTVISKSNNTAEVENTGAAASGVTLGGIVGRIEAFDGGRNTISYCENEGHIIFDAASASDANMKSGMGGILGVHSGAIYDGADKKKYHKSSEIKIENCTNSGYLNKSGKGSANFYMGGIAGAFNSLLESGQTYSQKGSVNSCVNLGQLTDESTDQAAVTGDLIAYTSDVVLQ